MNRVAGRAKIALILVLVLVLGMGFFVWEYAAYGGDWATFPGNPHIYNAGNIGCGTVTDRGGVTLLKIDGSRAYAEDLLLRESTLHWLGDREGFISAPALPHYAREMSGFDRFNGLYSYGGTGAGGAKLTLSARVQTAALEALDGRKGTVAVYNYKTGELLCAVTSPTFDPDDVPDIANDDSGAYDGVYLNRFLQAAYPPGSIFKVVTTGAALESMPEIWEETFVCTGENYLGGGLVTCESVHGEVNLPQALTQSCNCYFSNLGQRLGAETLKKYAEQFQVTQSLTFDGITTAEGGAEFPEDDVLALGWSAVGQHRDLVNPCRYMTFMGSIAAGGSGALPYVVAKTFVGDKTTYTAQTLFSEEIMSEKTAKTLRTYLRDNVINNYGDDNFPGLSVCAKSGTAELGDSQTSNAMFAGFVEDEAYPLAFFVAVENGGYGSSVCVPILSQVLESCKDVLDME